MFKHGTPKKVIINEYLLASEHFLEKIQTGYLNAILDKIAKELEKMNKKCYLYKFSLPF